MNSTVASSLWPAPATSPEWVRWRFAQPYATQRSAGLRWHMARHGSFVPGRLPRVFILLCLVSLGIGLAFWGAGAPAVLPLAGVEVLLLGLAFCASSRHAGDAETITLAARELQVEHRCGRRLEQAAFRAEWLRVEPAHAEGSLVELTGQGRCMRVGRYLRPELRPALARELRQAMRLACLQPGVGESHLEQQR